MDLNGLAKWQSWRDLEETPQDVAKAKYIELVAKCIDNYL